jgi:hypothetical protein
MTRDCYGTLPDLSPYGYRIIEQLGLNCAGGRSHIKLSITKLKTGCN